MVFFYWSLQIAIYSDQLYTVIAVYSNQLSPALLRIVYFSYVPAGHSTYDVSLMYRRILVPRVCTLVFFITNCAAHRQSDAMCRLCSVAPCIPMRPDFHQLVRFREGKAVLTFNQPHSINTLRYTCVGSIV